jgi:hypothetical protein
MASTYTPLGIELMATGENAGTWGTKTNTNLSLFEQITGGFSQVSIAGGANTTDLTVIDGTTTGTAQYRMIELTGAITGNQVVTIPLDVETFYFLRNSTTGSFTVQFKYTSGSGTTATFATGDKGDKLLFAAANDATNPDIKEISFSITQLTSNLDANGNNIDFDDNTGIRDDSGNEQLIFQKTASAVNHFDVTNAATGNNPSISAVGDDTNISINLIPKGTGEVQSNGSGLATTGKAIAMALVFG